ncbi:MAG: SMI1/KNR4 family protein [Flavobacteriales bacterium]|nr:SMI1/KNR4 family protein [Flavobacteriales bacterium]MBK6943368.1 SMI1/KNR4 family protein [Flavobacteriales bacterium]MBK7240753.1 SMI1/KNR4 family protein [Flavobacteriales bacterium]MBK7296634.1 SMI1/KNR4 family protein [Flavobacteriales bacterium]MBK9536100.1 SMI1/KNR4 family protein [Flavobacteriales bacterium]
MPFPVERRFIEDTERELGVQFPDAFKKKMMLMNGSEVSVASEVWQLFPFWDKSDSKRLSRTCNHIGLETKNAKSSLSFPAEAIAIATNGAGDHLVFIPTFPGSAKLAENLQVWLHETGKLIPTRSILK